MKQINFTEFHTKLFAELKKGKEILLDRKDYFYKDINTGDIFGKLEPQVNGYVYLIKEAA
jgi:hypothetical protein